MPKPSKQPPPVCVPDVLAEEAGVLRARRDSLFPKQTTLSKDRAPAALGVAFSGGGIRSATFNLGILQGLAERGLLPHIDYLSTVSGGGYIGSWLHGIIRHRHSGDPTAAQRDLHPGRVPGQPEDDPIAFLRKYSNYLAPRLGIFSPDFWTIESVWLRNISLNLLILVPFLAGCVLTILLAGILQQEYGLDVSSNPVRHVWWAVALFLAVFVIGMNLRQIVQDRARPWPRPSAVSRSAATFDRLLHAPRRLWRRLTPLFTNLNWGGPPVPFAVSCAMFAAYLLGAFRFEPDTTRSFLLMFGLFWLLQFVGGFPQCYRSRHPGKRSLPHMIWIPTVCAAVTAFLMRMAWDWTSVWIKPDEEWLRISLGPTIVLATWISGVTLQIGLMGSDFPDAAREWLATLGAKISIFLTCWIGLFVLAVFGPYWLAKLTLRYLSGGIAAAGGWIAAGAAAYFSGSSSKTRGGSDAHHDDPVSRAMELIGRTAPIAFLAGFLLFVSLATHILLRFLANQPELTEGCITSVFEKVPDYLLWLEPVKREYWCFAHTGHFLLPSVIFLWFVCAAIVVIVSLRLNINEFSMHHFYKNRLVRCYLGAGRAAIRRPNALTGFDPEDDFPLAEMRPEDQYFGPYPIINCALNLNTGSELAQQERRGASFVFTPSFCGFEPSHSREDIAETRKDRTLYIDGYRSSQGYMYPDGPRLGAAMAISGAAANPDSGYHTSAPLAFLMTIFNVRLGWWLGNPRRDGNSARPGPRFALGSLLAELFALSNGRSGYVNVSDGGHFDNLGLYELVRRRCPYIIACDAEADPLLLFEGLGGAIRKCRADFGVEITIDPSPIHRGERHCVAGTIHYPDAPAGRLLYIKANLTGDEPADVQQYRSTRETFPHESTADQFFSESQFESYRTLGIHELGSAFEAVRTWPSAETEENMRIMFEELSRIHTSPAPGTPGTRDARPGTESSRAPSTTDAS